jgi:hypothetical protein
MPRTLQRFMWCQRRIWPTLPRYKFFFSFLFLCCIWCKRRNCHTHTYIHTYTHTHTYIHTCMHTYIHTYIHTCIHTCMHTYMHTYTHTYIHTYVSLIHRGCKCSRARIFFFCAAVVLTFCSHGCRYLLPLPIVLSSLHGHSIRTFVRTWSHHQNVCHEHGHSIRTFVRTWSHHRCIWLHMIILRAYSWPHTLVNHTLFRLHMITPYFACTWSYSAYHQCSCQYMRRSWSRSHHQ